MIANSKDTPRDENAALRWAVDTFRRNAQCLKGNRQDTLARHAEWFRTFGRAIPRNDSIELLFPESSELLKSDEIAAMVKDARDGDEITGKFLLEVAATALERGHLLPASLREFVVEFLRNPRRTNPKAGRNRFHLRSRNYIICFVVCTIHIRWAFSVTRNEATSGASAVSIAKKALERVGVNLTEPGITKLLNGSAWKKSLDGWKQMRAIK